MAKDEKNDLSSYIVKMWLLYPEMAKKEMTYTVTLLTSIKWAKIFVKLSKEAGKETEKERIET